MLSVEIYNEPVFGLMKNLDDRSQRTVPKRALYTLNRNTVVVVLTVDHWLSFHVLDGQRILGAADEAAVTASTSGGNSGW